MFCGVEWITGVILLSPPYQVTPYKALNNPMRQSRNPAESSARWQKNKTLNVNATIDNNSNVIGTFKLF